MSKTLQVNLPRPKVGVPVSGSRTGEKCKKCKDGHYEFAQLEKRTTINGFKCTYHEEFSKCDRCNHFIASDEQQYDNLGQLEHLIDLTKRKKTNWTQKNEVKDLKCS